MSDNNRHNRINPGAFGPGVIGHENWEAEQAIAQELGQIFGPGVVDQNREAELLETPAAREHMRQKLEPPGDPTRGLPAEPVNTMGPGVMGYGSPTSPMPPSFSLQELEKTLEKSPLVVDRFLPAELNRPNGARRVALEAIRAAELRRPGGPREDVLAQVSAALIPDQPAPSPGSPRSR